MSDQAEAARIKKKIARALELLRELESSETPDESKIKQARKSIKSGSRKKVK